ncbi:hypothetical protein C1O66_17225 [Paucibacter aquatile]|uniref:Uncharacterized protein n=1 Tax=Kinneretia aquatilis TaxID=2070761 RepID=A0A2N8L056_9BURK|nr:hypothetical protein C1O66_17225 [Paucibacter aquatile]
MLAKAIVRAHPVKDDGQADLATVLKETETDQDGKYTLSVPTTPGKLYVIRISAKADGSTTQKDEITGQAQALPASFALRAVVAASASVTKTDLNITPFTEMATAAAEKASGGLTVANKDQAQSNVVQMLGFDPAKVKPTDIANASTDEEKKLAVMLTSVAQLAKDGALGCADQTQAGERVRCVVQKLAESAKIDSTKPGTVGGVNVADKLVEAVNKVVTTPELNQGKVDDKIVNVALGNLKGDGKPAPISNSGDVAAARKLFDELRSSAQALVKPDAGATTGALQKEAERFGAALDSVEAPVMLATHTSSALLGGIQGLIDYKEGLGPNNGGGLYGEVPGGPAQLNAVGCTIYQDEARTVAATSADNARFLGCSVRYGVTAFNDVNQGGKYVLAHVRHRLFITPGSNAGEYSYSARAQAIVCKDTNFCSTGQAFKVYDLQSQPAVDFSGTVKVTVEALRIKSFEIQGELPAKFKDEVSAPKSSADILYNPNGKASFTLKGSRNVIVPATAKKGDVETVNVEGKLAIYKDGAGSLDSELSILTGSQLQSVVVADGSQAREMGGFNLQLLAGTPKAEIEGQFKVSQLVNDKSGKTLTPSEALLSGAVRNKGDDGKAQASFFAGKISASLTGYAQYDDTLPKSATNNYKVSLALDGSLTADQRPQLKLNLGLSSSAWSGANDAKLDGQYKVLNKDKVETLVINLSASQAASDGKASFKLSEATSGLNFATDGKQSVLDLKKGDVKIGVIDLDSSRITFTNGEFWSLN